MPKYFIDENELYRVAFDDGEWVDIKKELSQRDQDTILNSMAKAKGKNPELELNLGKQTLLEICVKAWSFKDVQPIPVTPDNLSNLKVKYRSKVLTEIDRLNKEASNFLPVTASI
jgi:hypothetical protein